MGRCRLSFWRTLGLWRGSEHLVVTAERAKAGFMGVFPGPLDEDQRHVHGLHSDQGVVLRQVVADGPAGQAGLKAGDILVALSGRPVGRTDLGRRLTEIGAGETIDVTIIREGRRLTLPLTLGERPNPN